LLIFDSRMTMRGDNDVFDGMAGTYPAMTEGQAQDDDEGFRMTQKRKIRRKNMRKSQFIFVLMLSTSFATMARADDTSLANCLKAAKEGNCVQIGTSGTYYALSGDAGNKTMTIYGTTESGSNAATVPNLAFFDDGYWKSTFPGDVKSLKTSGNVDIGNNAFEYATGLTSVDLTGVQTIGYAAFYNATSLTSANLTGVQTIDARAFEGATGLTSVVISNSLLDSSGNILRYAKRNGVYTGISSSTFAASGLETIYCPEGNACGNSFKDVTPRIISYSIDNNGPIKAGGKTYASLDDLASGNYIPKRIYTIDEANAVAGKVNSVKIRYR